MKKAFVFDFDDTLAFTDAHVLVRRERGREYEWHRLTPAEFNRYELQDGERFDFSEFNNPEYILVISFFLFIVLLFYLFQCMKIVCFQSPNAFTRNF